LGRRRRKEDIPDDQDRCRKSDGDQRVLIHVGDSNSEKPYVPEPGQLLRDEKDDTLEALLPPTSRPEAIHGLSGLPERIQNNLGKNGRRVGSREKSHNDIPGSATTPTKEPFHVTQILVPVRESNPLRGFPDPSSGRYL